VARHAQATTVWVTLEPAETDRSPAVRLVVTDDGVGLDASRAARTDGDSGHVGLRLLRERVSETGGSVRLVNRPEGGAMLEVVVPVECEP
jgi:signal transduction histidine kinase